MTSWTFAKIISNRLKVIQGQGYNYDDIFLCKIWFPRNYTTCSPCMFFRLSTAKTIDRYVAFFGPRRCDLLIWLSINGCCITCIVNQDRCFLLLVSKLSAGHSSSQKKIYKCARCLRNDAHHVIGYHTSIRISFVFLVFFFIRIFHRCDFCKTSTNPSHVSISVFVLIIGFFYTVFVRRVWF